MKKKILFGAVIAMTFLTGTFAGGCGSQNPDTKVKASSEYSLERLGYASDDRNVVEYRDTKTGNHYFYVSGYDLIPRYNNASGSLYVD